MKLTSFHIVVSSFAALAGVALAAYQAFAPGPDKPVTVTVALDAPAADQTVTKSDAAVTIATASIDLLQNASFSAAMKDDSGERYAFGKLFDNKPETYLTLTGEDTEFNIMVTFGGAAAQEVTALVYTPPANLPPERLASVIDVTVLPDGQMEASGRPVYSFSLQRSPGSQTFAIPGRATGRGLWLRIAGQGSDVSVGDFRIVKEAIAQ